MGQSTIVLHLLVEPGMEPIPAGLTVTLFDADLRVVDETTGRSLATGKHVGIRGPDAEIKRWLRPFAGVWVGQGTPALQQFVVMHIR
jgi:hypothetical protein